MSNPYESKSISYEFKFLYGTASPLKTAPPISSFAVMGGASRIVHVDSPDDLSIGSEFEQARSFKNIMLFMPGTPGTGDMETAVDLMKLANDKSRMSFSFLVRRYVNKQMIYLLQIVDEGASLKKPPAMIHGGLLMMEFNLPSAKITHWDNPSYSSGKEL